MPRAVGKVRESAVAKVGFEQDLEGCVLIKKEERKGTQMMCNAGVRFPLFLLQAV